MRKKLVTIVLFAGSYIYGQDLAGTWQGTLEVPRSLRIELVISQTGSSYKGRFYSIDQDPNGIPTGPITLRGGHVHVDIGLVGGSYDGSLLPSSRVVDGQLHLGGSDRPLRLTHVTDAEAWTIPKAIARLAPMETTLDPSFEVVTIKKSTPDARGRAITMRGHEFVAKNVSVLDLMAFAYRLHPSQIQNTPDWAGEEHFDIVGIPDKPGMPNDEQLRSMLTKLLQDRFSLRSHDAQSQMEVYVISEAPSRVTLARSTADASSLPSMSFRKLGQLMARNTSMTDFANFMESTVLNLPVIDRAALPDRYDFTLNWTPDESQFSQLGIHPPAPGSGDADAFPPLFTAMKQQLGLLLTAKKTVVPVLSIDNVTKPSPN